MSWKASLSRHLSVVRFFGCPKSPASRGVMGYYTKNYEELKQLNPTMPLLLRCTDNAMPAITTELDFTTTHLLKYMLQNNKFADEGRADAARKFLGYLSDDELKKEYEVSRWNSPGFDPQRPFIEDSDPDWRAEHGDKLKRYIEIHDELEATWNEIKSGPDGEFARAENGLLMCQRVDLWCAGEGEVEAALKHLLNLGRDVNDLEPDLPEYVTEFYPGAPDL
ncbi:hypothetical protein THAOC_02274 [Thalassiosira oceanica]|uniref:Ribosomal protein/NADH dehydrogenase domain-containing protein n=1 Tax=Thalassiosira oceanica TaxID=159749 RepID=K0TB31_THAOC|nr:hypothetical protein THAOC_02274 [Thalassiosira oceanica]|eukprot:EJK75983.1 hypothetical protein THAOC_02274 [Thalassiosira oceanica]